MRHRLLLGLRTGLAAGLSVALLAGCTSSSDEPESSRTFARAAAPSVALAVADGLSAPVTVGVVVSGTSPRGEGAEQLGPAAGARVAEFRANLGKDAPVVRLAVADDRGTADGAAAAVRALQGQGVAGIVYASDGRHLAAGLTAAAQADLPVLLPYLTAPLPAGATTSFRTGPSGRQVAESLRALLRSRSLSAPFLLTGEGVSPDLLSLAGPGRTGRLAAGPTLLAAAEQAAGSLSAGRSDAVVLAASAASQAEAVAALQEYDASTTVVLSPTALSPIFSARLANLGEAGAATTAGQYFTAGTAATDSSTSAAVAGWLAALRLAASDGVTKALVGDGLFGDGPAGVADARSHDAVLALVAAAAKAGSASPERVLAALRTTPVDAEVGLAGPPLAFEDAEAVADADVVVLQATRRDAGQRGDVEGLPAITWFAVTDAAAPSAPAAPAPSPTG
jgi:branched-chain amino acid transport system substrate-binding protein